MIFFSGFGLYGEETLFSDFLDQGRYTVAGFSYGAIRAFESVSRDEIGHRVDRLILLSPAFFQTQTMAFMRTQLIHYSKNPEIYMERFYQNAIRPGSLKLSSFVTKHSIDALETLLSYEWKTERLHTLKERGIEVDVVLGGKDVIIDTRQALDHFSQVSTVYYFKEFGHFLR